jgi:hypothetical protein
MDGKSLAIGVLVATAILLGGVVANGLRQERVAYAQGGVYATYLATSANMSENNATFAVLDTETRRLLFYRVDVPKMLLEPIPKGADLTRDFQHKGP